MGRDIEEAAEMLEGSLAGSPKDRLAAARTLITVNPALFGPSVVPVLAGLVANPDPVIAGNAVNALGLLGPIAAAAVPSLADALLVGPESLQAAILATLRAIGPASRQAGPAIFQLVKKKGQIWASAAHALKSIYGILNIDEKTIIGYDDFQEFLKHVPDSSRLPESHEEKRPKFLTDILAAGPKAGGYVELAQTLETLNHQFRQELAGHLEPALNAHIQAMPHSVYDEKKTLAKWVNDELRRFDLAIKCPKTGQPSILLAGPGNHPEIGRFMLEHRTPEGKRVRPVQTPELPHIELMEATPRREFFLEMRDKGSRQSGGSNRGG